MLMSLRMSQTVRVSTQNNQPLNAAGSDEYSEDDVDAEIDDGDDEGVMIDQDNDVTQELEGNFFNNFIPDDAYNPGGILIKPQGFNSGKGN